MLICRSSFFVPPTPAPPTNQEEGERFVCNGRSAPGGRVCKGGMQTPSVERALGKTCGLTAPLEMARTLGSSRPKQKPAARFAKGAQRGVETRRVEELRHTDREPSPINHCSWRRS
jgi:hypothetical protein